MNDIPMFSILIPTKNRSHLVDYAIRSVIQQDFADYELIVCDNDDDQFATRNVVDRYAHDARIRYLRTGGLDMVGNWNEALRAARGAYVTVLEDKMILYPGALSAISKKISKVGSGVVVWPTDAIVDVSVDVKLQQSARVEDRLMSSKDVFDSLTKDIMKNWNLLPRGLSCVVPLSLIKNIVSETGADYFEPVSPDFVSAIKVLSSVDSILISGVAYTLVVTSKTSNGKNIQMGKEEDISYYTGNKSMRFSCEFVAMKNYMIVANSVVNDYRKIAFKYGGRYASHPITNKNYVQMMTREFMRSTLLARKIVWGMRDFRQLLASEQEYLSNAFRILLYIIRYLSDYLMRRLKLKSPEKLYIVTRIVGDSLHGVEQFLSGKCALGQVSSF